MESTLEKIQAANLRRNELLVEVCRLKRQIEILDDELIAERLLLDKLQQQFEKELLQDRG